MSNHHNTASLSTQLPDAAPTVEAQWVQLLPTGNASPIDGREGWSVGDPAAIINASLAVLKRGLPVDFDHAMERKDRTVAAPAAGWIEALEARADGIYGLVKWTGEGRDRIKGREYRYISPVFTHDRDRNVLRIIRAGLTNTPALEMAAICEAETDMADTNGFGAFHAGLVDIFGLPASATVEDTVAALKAALSDEVTAASAHATQEFEAVLTDVARGQAEQRAVTSVDAAMRDGKLPPALKEWGLALARSELSAFTAFVEGSPHLVGGAPLSSASYAPKDRHSDLSNAEREVARQLGILDV